MKPSRHKKPAFITTLFLGASLLVSQPAFAVSDAEFAALKAQMASFASQLEEMQTQQKILKAENISLKQKNNELLVQNNELVTKIDTSIEEKIEEISARSDNEALASIQPAAGNSDGALIPGTDTRIKFGGYVKVDAIHDLTHSRDGNGEDFGLYAAIPLDGSTEDRKGGNTRLHARQSRINVTTKTPTEFGDLKVFVEGDFMASQGSQTTTNRADFGLRHAYGQLGPVLIGQTWSNFMDLAAYPESLDFIGVAGNSLVRQGQIRYTHTPEGSENSYSIAIENPNSEFLSDPSNSGVDSAIEKYPDIIAKARFVGDYGETSLKAIARKLEAYDTGGNGSDSDFGYAVGASGKINLFDKDNLRFQVAYGDGIGRYLFDLAATGQGAGFTTNARRSLETVEAWGGYLAYQHWWNDDWRSNFMAGTTQILDNPDFLNPASTNKEIYSANANVIWSVTDKVDVGGEYIYGFRETENGSEGEMQRLQLSAKYKF